MQNEFTLPTQAIRVYAESHLVPMEKYLLGTLTQETYYDASGVVDIPRHIFNEEIRETLIPIFRMYNVSFLILRGAGTNPYPVVDDGHPDPTTFRNRSRSLIVLLRGEESVSEDFLITMGEHLCSLDPRSTFQPHTRILRVEAHEIDAMTVESVVDGRVPWEACLHDLAEDLALYLYRHFEHLAPVFSADRLEATLFQVHSQCVADAGFVPFPSMWIVQDGMVRNPFLRVLHRPDIHEALQHVSGPIYDLPDGVQEHLEIVAKEYLTVKDVNFYLINLKGHDFLNYLMDGDVIEPRMLRL